MEILLIGLILLFAMLVTEFIITPILMRVCPNPFLIWRMGSFVYDIHMINDAITWLEKRKPIKAKFIKEQMLLVADA